LKLEIAGKVLKLPAIAGSYFEPCLMTEVNDNYRVYKKKVIELQRTIVREPLGVIYEQIFFIFGKIRLLAIECQVEKK
jgi:hypothetical protein